MSEYHTIQPEECLTFFMGKWRELHLHEFEHSDTDFSFSDCDSSVGSLFNDNTSSSNRGGRTKKHIPDDFLSPKKKSSKNNKATMALSATARTPTKQTQTQTPTRTKTKIKTMIPKDTESSSSLNRSMRENFPDDWLVSPKRRMISLKGKAALSDDEGGSLRSFHSSGSTAKDDGKNLYHDDEDDDDDVDDVIEIEDDEGEQKQQQKQSRPKHNKKKIAARTIPTNRNAFSDDDCRIKKKSSTNNSNNNNNLILNNNSKKKSGGGSGGGSGSGSGSGSDSGGGGGGNIPDEWFSPKKKPMAATKATSATTAAAKKNMLVVDVHDERKALTTTKASTAATASTTREDDDDDNNDNNNNNINNSKTYVKKFLDIINSVNPYKGEILSPRKVKRLLILMNEYPQLLCQQKHTFLSFPGEYIYPLHVLCAIAAPISCIKRCLKHCPSAINDDSTQLGTPIHYACAFHYHPTFTIAGGTGTGTGGNTTDDEESIKKKDDRGGDSLRVCQFLIYKNANALRILNRKKQQTALHIACSAPFFCPHSDTNTNTTTATTMDNEMMVLWNEKRNSIVVYLTEVCPKLAEVVDRDKNTPLHIACSVVNPSKGIIKQLSTIASQTCLSFNINGSTPLHLVVGGGVKKKGMNSNNDDNTSSTANTDTDTDNNTNTTNNIYSTDEYRKVVKQLLRTNNIALRILDKNGDIPLHVAIQSKVDTIKVYKILLEGYPESVTVKNTNGELPYTCAQKLNLSSSIVKFLSSSSSSLEKK